MRALVWCQHSIGVGHLARAMQIAESISQDAAVDLVCGGAIPEVFRKFSSVTLHQLPPVQMNPEGLLMVSDSIACDDALLAMRQERLLEIADSTAPDVLVVEMFPFGRKKLAAEIIALVNHVKKQFGTRIVCSLRDVLITTRRDQARFDGIAMQRLNDLFDLLLVHGDPSVIRLQDTLANFGDIRIPWRYTGYIARPPLACVPERGRQLVVSAGGGRVGQRLLGIAAECADRFRDELDLATVLITGPHGSSGALMGLPVNVRVVDFVDDLPGLLASSMVSVSQCGYNTATDILASGVASVVVPYETERENEQLLRATSLDQRGWSVMLREHSLDGETLFEAVSRALSRLSMNSDASLPVALNGLESTRKYIREIAEHA